MRKLGNGLKLENRLHVGFASFLIDGLNEENQFLGGYHLYFYKVFLRISNKKVRDT